jgi:hypothetical protein
MTDTNIGDMEATEASDNQTQVESKTYTQKEVDDMMARMKNSLKSKLLKPYEELGDINELKQLREQAHKQQQEQAMKRGEFDKIIQDLASKKDQEIQKRDQIIQGYKVDMPILESAAKYRAVAPEQVKSLLKDRVRLNAEGEVEVLDAQGSVRYSDAGTPVSVDELVKEFLDSNRHFVQATAATTNSKSSIAVPGGRELDVTKLDMKNPAHRKLYAEHKKSVRA